MRHRRWIYLIVGVLASGCQPRVDHPSGVPRQAAPPAARSQDVLAYFNDRALTWRDVQTPLLQTAGGEVLAELILQRQIDAALEALETPITEEDLARERVILGQQLSEDADRAARLLRELRTRRGSGPFDRRLRINAGLRKLIAADVSITPASLRAMYELTYGARYEARLIVVETLQEAVDVLKAARAGVPFMDLAMQHSTDTSGAQGGLMPPISPVDPTYPKGVREVVAQLEEGAISDPVALEQGYALLRLEQKIEAQPVEFADVREEMERQVRRQQEEILMQQKLRALLSTANVTVLDADLAQRWERQKQRMLQSGE